MNNPTAGMPGTAAQLQRMENQLTDLNARIARLALALGVPLDTEHDVQAALTSLQPPVIAIERRVTADRRGASRGGSDRRRGASRLELRGLLVLRYGTELRLVEQVGVASTRQVLHAVEQRLEHQGFEPGADGVHLDRPAGTA